VDRQETKQGQLTISVDKMTIFRHGRVKGARPLCQINFIAWPLAKYSHAKAIKRFLLSRRAL